MDAAARTALSVAYDHGRDEELRELRLLLAERNREIAELRDRQRMLEQRVLTNEREREASRWEALCQAGIRMRGFDVRHLVDLWITRSCWGITEGVLAANGSHVVPGPFNFAPNEHAVFLLPETTLIRILQDDFHARNWRPFEQYLTLLSESGIFQPREGGHFRRFDMLTMPRLFEEYFDSDDESLSEGSDMSEDL